MLKKGTEFTWNHSYQETFDTMKCLVCIYSTLRYLNVHKPNTIQTDTSQKGLTATLLQIGHPAAFASKAWTPVEQYYANIEHEMLTCVFGVDWFYIYFWATHSLSRVTTSLWTDQADEPGRCASLPLETAFPCRTVMSPSSTTLIDNAHPWCNVLNMWSIIHLHQISK